MSLDFLSFTIAVSGLHSIQFGTLRRYYCLFSGSNSGGLCHIPFRGGSRLKNQYTVIIILLPQAFMGRCR
jgi:hypothetical protein